MWVVYEISDSIDNGFYVGGFDATIDFCESHDDYDFEWVDASEAWRYTGGNL